MKTLVAFRFTGEDPKQLEPLMVAIRDTLQAKAITVYCTFFDEDEFQGKSLGPKQIMEHAFGVIDSIDFLFVVQTSDNKSEGMLMEVGYCIAKDIPVVTATKTSVGYTYLPEMANLALRWKDPDDLKSQLAATDFSQLA